MKNAAQTLIADLDRKLASLGRFRARAMFGGHGLYLDDLIFGLIAYDRLYLKADDANRADYGKSGSRPFTYDSGTGKRATMSYWECPEAIRADGAKLRRWVEKSLAASRRAKRPAKPKAMR